MDPEAFLDLANQVTKLKMFPYFDIAHSVLCALHVREDLGAGKTELFLNAALFLFLSRALLVLLSFSLRMIIFRGPWFSS